MPGIDAAGTLAVPIWLAGAAAVVFVVAILLAVKRASGVALITSLFHICLIAAVVFGAWLYVRERDASERRALDDRKMALMAGSALSCLDELAGEAVESACEKEVFATPEAVAAAVKYVTAQLALIDDGTAYAKRDASYAAELAPLRTAVELDRFGLVAQVLKEREGCTADHCDALTQFHESTRVLGNSHPSCLLPLASVIASPSAGSPAAHSAIAEPLPAFADLLCGDFGRLAVALYYLFTGIDSVRNAPRRLSP